MSKENIYNKHLNDKQSFNREGDALTPIVHVNNRRNNEVMRETTTITGNADVLLTINDIKAPFVYIIITSQNEHNFRLDVVWRVLDLGSGYSSTVKSLGNVEASNNSRLINTEWLEVNGKSLSVRVKNDSELSQTYQVLVYEV